MFIPWNVREVLKMLISISQSQTLRLKLLPLSKQQPKIQKLFIYFHQWHRKAANTHIQDTKPVVLFTFLFEKWLERLIDY